MGKGSQVGGDMNKNTHEECQGWLEGPGCSVRVAIHLALSTKQEGWTMSYRLEKSWRRFRRKGVLETGATWTVVWQEESSRRQDLVEGGSWGLAQAGEHWVRGAEWWPGCLLNAFAI